MPRLVPSDSPQATPTDLETRALATVMGRLVDAGLLRPWLQEHCPTEHYGLCAYLDGLPTTSRAFLWYPESPLQRQGGWEATRAEYGRIVRGTLTV